MLILYRFYDEVLTNNETPNSLRPVLKKLFLLFGLWRLQQHSVILVEGGFLSGSANTLLEAQALLCDYLKPEAMALVDAVAVPDYVLASPLGYSDGNAYRNLIQTMLREPGVFERPSYWEKLVPKKVEVGSSSQL